MKKKIIASFFVVTTLVLVFSQVSFAQDKMKNRLGLGARVSYVNPSDDNYSVYGYKVNVEPDECVMYELNLTYFIIKYFSFELGVDYAETDVDLSALGLSGDAGEMEQIQVFLSGRTHFAPDLKISPYFSYGIGYSFNDFNQNDANITLVYGPGAKIDVDDSFTYHLGAGIEFFISENTVVNLDFKYIWNEVEAGVNVPGFSDEDLDMDPYVFGLGIKYYF